MVKDRKICQVQCGTRFQRDVPLLLEIAKSLISQCRIRQENLCTANQLDLFRHFDTVWACDSQRDQTLSIAYTHYAHVACGKNNITQYNGHLVTRYCLLAYYMSCLQCFDTVGWAAGRASGQ